MNRALTAFHPAWRDDPRGAFDVEHTATGEGTVPWSVGGETLSVYRNVNLSIYSGQTCNARCPFCVEELRPASRGRALEAQRRVEPDDARYFGRLEAALDLVAPLSPSLSITGGEPSLDPRLPGILEVVRRHGLRKRTMTTNATGLLGATSGPGDLLDLVLAAGLSHLNISRAHWDESVNQRVMRINPAQSNADLALIVARANAAGVRVRLSCVLLAGLVADLDACERYLDWAASLGVDNVVFRQLMQYDRETALENGVTRFTDSAGVTLGLLLEALSASGRFTFVRHVLGYYYAVEVHRWDGPRGPIDVCLEAADLAAIERRRRAGDAVVHELIFHPDTALCSTWQPWSGRIW